MVQGSEYRLQVFFFWGGGVRIKSMNLGCNRIWVLRFLGFRNLLSRVFNVEDLGVEVGT